MKNFLRIFLVCFIFLPIQSCKQTSERTVSDKVEVIEVNVNKTEILQYSDVLKLKKVVSFDTSVIVSNIEKVEIVNDTIVLIKCGRKINRLVLKNLNSGLIQVIGNKGEGPGEYTKVSDFIYNENNSEVWILDGSQGKILKYDLMGNLQGEIKNKHLIHANTFYKLGDNKLLVYGGTFFYGMEKHGLIALDIVSGEVLERHFEIPENHSKFMFFIENRNFTQTGLFHYKFNRNFYKIKSNSIETNYIVDFGDKNLPNKILEDNYVDVRQFVESCKETSFAYGVSHLMDLPNGFFFTFNYKSDLMHCFYNYDSRNYILYNKFMNDIYGLGESEKTNYMSIPRGSDKNILVYIVEPFEFKTSLDEIRKTYTNQEWGRFYTQRKEWVDRFDSLSMDANSILVFLEIKQNVLNEKN